LEEEKEEEEEEAAWRDVNLEDLFAEFDVFLTK
jgi:hypothetical protein